MAIGINQYPEIRCLAAHKLSLDLPFNNCSRPLRVITFVREPIERYISYYFYLRNHTQLVPEAKSLSFDDFTDWALNEKNLEYLKNGQLQHLTGSSDESALDIVKKNISKYQILFLSMERYDESCVLLENVYREDFKDCSYTPQNISLKDLNITDDTRRELKKYFFYDYELFDLVNENMDSLIKKCFLDQDIYERDLVKFRLRCNRLNSPQRRLRKRLNSFLLKIVNRL